MRLSLLLSVSGLLTALVLSGGAFAQEDSAAPAQAVGKIALANQLATYGKANKDPVALIAAARIFKGAGAEAADRKKETEGGAAAEASVKAKAGPEIVKDLLDQARALANGKPEILALADSTGKTLGSRGAFGGPKQSLSTVSVGTRDVYRLPFRAGEIAMVAVVTDGASDLSLQVYDSNMNLVCADIELDQALLCKWKPRTIGQYIVKVGNAGVARSDYILMTN